MGDSDERITYHSVINSEEENLLMKETKNILCKEAKESDVTIDDKKKREGKVERNEPEFEEMKDENVNVKLDMTKTDEEGGMKAVCGEETKGEEEVIKWMPEEERGASEIEKTEIDKEEGMKDGGEEETRGKEEDVKLMDEEDSGVASDERETRNTFILSISFLCVFSSYFAIQSLQGSLNDEDGLGVISLSCLYGATILSSTIAPMCVAMISVKKIILIAFTIHLIYTASNFYPSFATLIPSSLLLGSITGPLWGCQGIYITTNAMSYAKENKITKFAALSRFNGIFWSLFELSNIVGNLLASSVLYQGKYNHTVPNASEYCGINDCPGTETMDIIADPEPIIVYILLGVFLCCISGGIVVILVFLPAKMSQKSEERTTVKKLLFLWFTTIANTDMKFLLPLTLYLSMAEGFCFAEITKSYVSCPIGIQNVGYAMTTYGVNTAVFSFVFSRLAKFTKRYILISFAAAIHLSLQIWIYHWVPTEEDTVLVYVLIGVWGLGDAIWITQYPALLGAHFPDHYTSVFAIGEGVKAISLTAAFIYSSLLCMRVKVLTVIAFLIVGTLLYYFVEIRFQRKQKKTTDQEDAIDTDDNSPAI